MADQAMPDKTITNQVITNKAIKNKAKTYHRKSPTLNKYLLKGQLWVTLLVIVSYSIMLPWYFVRGLDASSLMQLQLEAESYAKAYNQAYKKGVTPQLPRSVHFTGYLGWETTPEWVRREFPELQQVDELTISDTKKFSLNFYKGLPDKVLFVVAEPLDDGKIFYLTREIHPEDDVSYLDKRISAMLNTTWPMALSFLVLVLVAVYLLQRRLVRPMESLGDWSASLSLDEVHRELPDFDIRELNSIARQQQQSLQRIADMIENEQDFLRHASHELRTPIAVVSSNSELLQRVAEDTRAEKPVNRISRAAKNMQQMTETLLWLSREQEQPIAAIDVNLSQMLRDVIEDNQYLLTGKSVDIHLDIDELVLRLLETPCRLVLNNLLRNAFQYTDAGRVRIVCRERSVTIENVNQSEQDLALNSPLKNNPTESSDYGYGLGLRLVEKIVTKMHWQYTHQEIPGGRRVEIYF